MAKTTKQDEAKRPRPPNPRCGTEGCNHSQSFHPIPRGKGPRANRPCGAYGCTCAKFTKGEA